MLATYVEVGFDDKHNLAEWLSSDVWNNFTNPTVTYEAALLRIEQGAFHGEDKKTFWIHSKVREKIGLVQLYDLLDSTGMFDLRLNTEARGKGVGRQALHWLTSYVFENYPGISRIEANTRQDNIAMRKVLRACGYVKEAHYRAGWETGGGPSDWVDSVAYAILRYDWEHRITSPVHWDDEGSL